MRMRIDPDQFMPIAAIALMVLSMTACALQLRNDDDAGAITSPVSEELGPFATRLNHCRTVTSDQTAELASCRLVWAESRRRFLNSTKPNWSASPEAKPIEPAPGTKYPDRVLPPAVNNEQNETR